MGQESCIQDSAADFLGDFSQIASSLCASDPPVCKMGAIVLPCLLRLYMLQVRDCLLYSVYVQHLAQKSPDLSWCHCNINKEDDKCHQLMGNQFPCLT